jgi:HD-GYP domain-containing protein (c-di-GMP phosphodiesterase class II)
MEMIRTFMSVLTTAISNCSLYSRDHTSVDNFTRKSAAALDSLLRESAGLEIMHVGNKLVINEIPLSEIGLQGVKLINRLKSKRVSYVKFLPGITFDELKQFIVEMVATDKKMPLFPHIKTGVLGIQTDEAKAEDDFGSDDVSSIVSGQVEMLRDIYHDISQFKNPDMAMLNEIVGNFIDAFRKDTNILKLLSRAKSREEYSYVHATNVSVLSIFQTESLGLREKPILRDVGIAGLLHDVGKLFVSRVLLEKKGALDAKEWEEMKLHPLNGTKYLSSVEGLPRLATIVAFQHHLRQDGQGYPALRMMNINQHICSQIIAISDVFDALRSTRPYRRGLEIKEILLLMKKDSGSAFNPVFLDNFMLRINEALSE